MSRIPALETSISSLLRDISIVHRRAQRKILVTDYELRLRKLLTSLNDYLGKKGFPVSLPQKLHHLKIYIEG